MRWLIYWMFLVILGPLGDNILIYVNVREVMLIHRCIEYLSHIPGALYMFFHLGSQTLQDGSHIDNDSHGSIDLYSCQIGHLMNIWIIPLVILYVLLNYITDVLKIFGQPELGELYFFHYLVIFLLVPKEFLPSFLHLLLSLKNNLNSIFYIHLYSGHAMINENYDAMILFSLTFMKLSNILNLVQDHMHSFIPLQHFLVCYCTQQIFFLVAYEFFHKGISNQLISSIFLQEIFS